MGELLGQDGPNQEKAETASEKEHFIPLEGKPDHHAETPEGYEHPGEKIESVSSGDRMFAPGMLIRDRDERIAQITKVYLVKETRFVEDARTDRMTGIRRPKKLVRPRVVARYADNTEKDLDITEFEAVYATLAKKPVTEQEDFHQLINYKLREHNFVLGELVQYGYRVGRLASILSEEGKFGIIGSETPFGKPGPRFSWLVDMNEVDYIEWDEAGLIKKNPDDSLYKPTLGKVSNPNI